MALWQISRALILRDVGRISLCKISTSAPCNTETSEQDWPSVPEKWIKYNVQKYDPQQPGEERRPAWVCHYRTNIKYGEEKMRYVAWMIRGMSVDEAIKQLTFCRKKGAAIVKEIIEEAQELAVKEHNVEYKSNLWVAESFCTKGIVIKGYRRHARGRFGIIHWVHCHYYVKLEEGPPPKHYYPPEWTGNEKLHDWISSLRARRIGYTL